MVLVNFTTNYFVRKIYTQYKENTHYKSSDADITDGHLTILCFEYYNMSLSVQLNSTASYDTRKPEMNVFRALWTS